MPFSTSAINLSSIELISNHVIMFPFSLKTQTMILAQLLRGLCTITFQAYSLGCHLQNSILNLYSP
ncbi:hypothetical protein Gotur_002557 [Gossypium turneri]